ncbi:MAG: sugar phosphate isomerase/epimerase [Proteobacteria bacterium]|nr:sugar phosphate isomerase/epimerase [Pseudomonadota bacterium]MBU1714469.1 sugar phosphate isomerase/epimerase [Pseudomonadota bacterium]
MKEQFSQTISRCFVNAPFDRLRQDLLAKFIENRLQPEIGLEGDCLYNCSRQDFKDLARTFQAEGLACTIHAPFYDLSPGASDQYIRQSSLNKLKKSFELIEVFKPQSIVCHLSYEENKHGFKQDDWLKYSIETWQELLEIAGQYQTPMMLENTYETEPKQHQNILAALDSPYARFCLDVGHTLAFARTSWQEWLPALTPWLGQLHLHDNMGDMDNHLAIGHGIFDFAGLFDYLRQNDLSPIMTMEPHHEEQLWDSIAALDKLLFDKTPLTSPPHSTKNQP